MARCPVRAVAPKNASGGQATREVGKPCAARGQRKVDRWTHHARALPVVFAAAGCVGRAEGCAVHGTASTSVASTSASTISGRMGSVPAARRHITPTDRRRASIHVTLPIGSIKPIGFQTRRFLAAIRNEIQQAPTPTLEPTALLAHQRHQHKHEPPPCDPACRGGRRAARRAQAQARGPPGAPLQDLQGRRVAGVGPLAGHRQPVHQGQERTAPAVRRVPAYGAAAPARQLDSGTRGAGAARARPTCPPAQTGPTCTTGGSGGSTGCTTPTSTRRRCRPWHGLPASARRQRQAAQARRRARAGASGGGAEPGAARDLGAAVFISVFFSRAPQIPRGRAAGLF